MIGETLYAKYIKERAGRDILENESGFIIYRCHGEECFLVDMCVDHSKRGSRLFGQMMSQLVDIAKAAGCKIITATVYVADSGKEHTLSSVFKLGFKILKAEQGVILVGKEV